MTKLTEPDFIYAALGFTSEEEVQFSIECVLGSGDKYATPEAYEAGFEAWLNSKGITR